MNYDYPAKRHWRRWIWNRISERTKDKANAVVLFLAGTEAADISHAVSHGFKASNMIAVERDNATVKSLRSSGVLTIHGDIVDVLKVWPDGRSVDVVLGDFTCGLEMQILKVLSSMFDQRPFLGTTLALNFLRGRDKTFSPVRNELVLAFGNNDFTKNRAAMFAGLFLRKINSLLTDPDGGPIQQGHPGWDSALRAIEEVANPQFHSYRSTAGTQYFDSCVLTCPMAEIWSKFEGGAAPSNTRWCVPPMLRGQRARVSAVLAHHTRRSSPSARRAP